MFPQARGAVLWALVVGCLGWAAVEARHIQWRQLGAPVLAAPAAAPRVVEESFAAVRADLAAGRQEEGLLALRRRAAHGPYPGTAWFLLGEVALEQKAYAEAVRHYRRAVELDPAVADRAGAFASGRVIGERLTALLEGPWAQDRPPQVRDLYYLRRRLAGGCE